VSQELTFEEMANSEGKEKAGYDKIRFCGEQTAKDGLRHFWVDSCCIKKSNDAELSESLRSMYRWYERSVKCYVYLSDVSDKKRKTMDLDMGNTWEPSFRKSRWFTRGWTLQELLAPRSIEFFSREGRRLGDKQSLERQIHEITGIPVAALRGSTLTQFTIDQKFGWANSRQTTRVEDWAYSLLGIFEISMPVMYGEGRTESIRRLRKEIESASKDKECLQHLFKSDPRMDKRRIEEAKGGLLTESYHWVLEHRNFKQWYSDQQTRLLWIKGDPGKGKTMLLCGIINELNSSTSHPLAYFFCQATDSRLNNAEGVLRGLLYLLAIQQPSLIPHIQRYHNHAGKNLFEDANAWPALSEMLTNILQDSTLPKTYFIIDALDECKEGLLKLLNFISEVMPSCLSVKWLISSRNWFNIEQKLDKTGCKIKLDLELNAESVSAAVKIYIKHKVRDLANRKDYDRETEEAVLEHFYSNADDTFLWVALVYENLQEVKPWNVTAKLTIFPPGLDSLYGQMMRQIVDSDEANLCKRILALAAVVYRPVTLTELTSLVDIPRNISQNLKWLAQIISLCGSFLTVRGDVIYFVHQSARDYLLTKASAEIFPSGEGQIHYETFKRSIAAMSITLKRDMYEIRAPGCLIEQVKAPSPDPLSASCYSCVYWVDHLNEWDHPPGNSFTDLKVGGTVDVFIRNKYLYWLEALSLCRSVSQGVLGMAKLESLMEVGFSVNNVISEQDLLTAIKKRSEDPTMLELIRDARRFIMYNKLAIEISPLQVYVSAITFTPVNSLIKRQFQKEAPTWIKLKRAIRNEWSSCLQPLDGHNRFINSVIFSHDSTHFATASDDSTVKIWDTSSGDCLQILKGHANHVRSIAFSHDSARLASASNDRTLRIWDVSNGQYECVRAIDAHTDDVTSVTFSHDSTLLASASDDTTVKLWRSENGECVRTLEGHTNHVNAVAFSHDSGRLASASSDRTIRLWNTHSGECLSILIGHAHSVSSVTFSHESNQIASASNDYTLRIWNTSNGQCLRVFEGHTDCVCSVIYSHDSTKLASASRNSMIKIWSADSGECLQTLEGHTDNVTSIAFSHDSTSLASVAWDHTIRIWDVRDNNFEQTPDSHSRKVTSVAFSHDMTLLASVSGDGTLMIWNPASGNCLRRLKAHSDFITAVVFSNNSSRLATSSWDRTIKIWDSYSGECLQILTGHEDDVLSVVFSPTFSDDKTWLASSSDDYVVKIWDPDTGICLHTLRGHDSSVRCIAFSSDLTTLASGSDDPSIKIWDINEAAGNCLRTIIGHSDSVRSVTFSKDKSRLAAVSLDRTVRIWETDRFSCIQIFNTVFIGWALYNIAFNPVNSALLTDIGTIVIERLSASNAVEESRGYQGLRFSGVGLSLNGHWITYNSENLVWLPFEYRPRSSDVLGNTISIGAGTGRVWFCTLSIPSSGI
jgi:WD40 repeat protein